MATNQNIIRLLEMLENPEAYSEHEIRDIINSDDETREAYRLMVAAKQGYIHRQTEQPVDIQEAWQRFEQKHYSTKQSRHWIKIAASFIGLLLVSGITFAAYYIATENNHKTEMATTESRQPLQPAEVVGTIVRFDNVQLDSVLSVVALHYHKQVEYHNETLRNLHFHIEWNQTASLSDFITLINNFEGISLREEQDTIIVE